MSLKSDHNFTSYFAKTQTDKFQHKHNLLGGGYMVASPVLPSPPLPPPDLSAGSILAVRTLPAPLPSPKR